MKFTFPHFFSQFYVWLIVHVMFLSLLFLLFLNPQAKIDAFILSFLLETIRWSDFRLQQVLIFKRNRFSAFFFSKGKERKKIISRCDLSNNQNATGFKKAKCSRFVHSFHMFLFCSKLVLCCLWSMILKWNL